MSKPFANVDGGGEANKETIINKFKNYLMNYRAPAHDLDSSTSSIELDASFQRHIERKRQLTNKENNHPSKLSSDSGTASTGVQRESERGMPLGEIALEHCSEPIRNIPSWIMDDENMYSFNGDHSSTNRHEFSEINRLLANCDINLNDSSSPSMIGDVESVAMDTKSEAIDAGDSFADDSLEIISGIKTESDIPVELKIELSECPDDTLEEIEYDKHGNGLRYVPVKKYTGCPEPKVANQSLDDVILIESSPENSFVTARNNIDGKSMMTNADETFVTTNDMTHMSGRSANTNSTKASAVDFNTLEDVSTDSTSRTSKSNMIESEETHTVEADELREDSFDEIPEFDTTLERIEYIIEKGQRKQFHHTPKVKAVTNEMVTPGTASNSLYIAQAATPVTPSQSAIIHERSGATPGRSGATPGRSGATPGRSGATPGRSGATPGRSGATPGRPGATPGRPGATPGRSGATPGRSGATPGRSGATPGRSMATSNSAKKISSTDEQRTPVSATQKKMVHPKSCTQFKIPESRSSPLSMHSKPPMPAHGTCSKIPTLRAGPSAAAKFQFRHIASPVATYINNTVEVPLLQTVRLKNNKFLDPNIYGKTKNHNLDETIQSKNSTILSVGAQRPSLPKKIFKSAAERKITDHRHIVMPGGKTVQQLIGNVPLVIKHERRVNTQPMPRPSMINDTMSDTSMAAGDVSIQTVFDVRRNK